MLNKLRAFLARAPALAGVEVGVGDVSPAPGTAGLWAKGVTVLRRKTNLLGGVTLCSRAEFTLRLCLPLPPGDSDTAAENAAHLLDLQAWVAAESAARRAPLLGNTDPAGEILRAEQGKMERADAGTAVYTLRLQAEYTHYFEEEPNEN